MPAVESKPRTRNASMKAASATQAPETDSKEGLTVKGKKGAKGKEKVAAVPLLPVGETPLYPVSADSTSEPTWDSSVPIEIAVQRYFEESLGQEISSVEKAFTGEFAFVSAAVVDVCNRFSKSLKDDFVVKSIKELREADAETVVEEAVKHKSKAQEQAQENSANTENRGKLKGWQAMLEKIEAQSKQWAELESSWKDYKDPEADEQCAPADEKEEKLLSGNQANKLTPKVNQAYTHLSIKSDIILSAVKKLSQFVHNAVSTHKAIADSVNQAAFPYSNAKEPKQLIKAMLGGH